MKSTKNGPANQITLNRTESISQLYMDIKTGPSLIRCYAWEESAPRLMEFLNLKRVLVDSSAGGGGKFLYHRRPTQVDDSLHAVNFAYVLAKVMMGRSMINDYHLKDRVMASVMQQSGAYEESMSFGFGDIISG